MAINHPTPASAQPPPDVPADPTISVKLGQYLRQFAIWTRRGFASKIDTQTAAPGLLLQSYDTPRGATPTVWLLRVNSAGALSVVQAPLGQGLP